jgi:hypothetical protein
MAKQTFTAGQVLTAAQVNALQGDIYNQTVSTKVANYTLVAADAGTRLVGNGTSITFTVNNSLFTAGDTLKIHNINSTVLTIAAGAGVTINAAAGLTIAQYQEAVLFATSASSFVLFESSAATTTQGLSLISTTSFSGVATQSVNNVFSSTYKSYKIVVETDTGGASNLYLRLRVGGVSASTNYAFQWFRGTSTTVAGGGSVGTLGYFEATSNSATGGGPAFFEMILHRPFEASSTYILSNWFTNVFSTGQTAGYHSTATSYDGIELYPSTSTMTGSIKIYGLNQ